MLVFPYLREGAVLSLGRKVSLESLHYRTLLGGSQPLASKEVRK